jgi:hypothetical protein
MWYRFPIMGEVVTPTGRNGEVMASVDEGPDGGDRLVIADISRDGAWIAMPTRGTYAVSERR